MSAEADGPFNEATTSHRLFWVHVVNRVCTPYRDATVPTPADERSVCSRWIKTNATGVYEPRRNGSVTSGSEINAVPRSYKKMLTRTTRARDINAPRRGVGAEFDDVKYHL